MYYSAPSARDGGEGAIFIKKPLGGYSCASCEKDINDLNSLINQQPEYANWNKFPVKESTDRIPKV